MKKQAKGIIALSALLAALGGSYAVLKLTAPENGEEDKSSAVIETTSEAKGNGTILISENGAVTTVKKAVVKNGEGEINVILKDEPTEDTSATYTLEDYSDLDVDISMVGTLVNNGNGMAAEALIAENCTDLAKYGLEDPAATVEFTFESGNTAKFFIGDKAPSNSGTYVLVNGTDDVYTVSNSLMANYLRSVKEFISSTVLAKPDDDNYPKIDSIRIERGDMDEDMLIEYDKSSDDKNSGGTSATHVLVEPLFSYLTVEKSNGITNGMFGLAAKEIYALNCKESDIAGAGLSDPFCRVTMECGNGKTYVLLLSEIFTDESGEKCSYGMLEGGKVIYIISADNAKWLTVQPIDIVSRMLITNYVWNITDMTVSGGGKTVEMKVSRKDPEAILDSPSAEDFKVKKNGEELDAERFRQFYSFLVSSNAEEFALDEPVPDGEPAASIEFTDSYFGKTFRYDFYDDSLMRSLIVVDGKSKYYCTKSFVNTLIENIKRIDTGEDYVTTW
ncbi:MAG: DUF4340 domain-containing protein [Ruminococcus sp.]|nr:DUF4340 domain-containing protein [Ruminococcus sp.]